MGPRVKGIALGIVPGWLGSAIVARIADHMIWPGLGGQLQLAFSRGDQVLEVLVNLAIIVVGTVLTCHWLVGYFRRRAAAKAAAKAATAAALE